MNKDCFRKIYENVIEGYVNELKKIDEESGYNCLHFRKSRQYKVLDYYEKKRLDIRRYFMHLEEKPMDRHKIGSVMMYAILKSRLLDVKKSAAQTLPEQLLMANEYLAVYVALSIVESYKYDEYISAKEKNQSHTESDEENDSWRLILPKTFHEESEDAYINNTCKALYYIKDPEDFDIFAYSNILFLLEVYADAKHELNKHELNE